MTEYRLPKLVVFDLDYTLWPCFADQHLKPPFTGHVSSSQPTTAQHTGHVTKVTDSRGKSIALYPDVIKILDYLKSREVPVAIASKSAKAAMYQDLIRAFGIYEYFVQFEIYPRTKDQHMRAISEEQHVDYSDMVFYDDKLNNIRKARKVGVTSLHCPGAGVTWEVFVGGLRQHVS